MEEGWVFFFYHIISPPFLSTVRFYDFFFPKVGNLRGEKKNKNKTANQSLSRDHIGRISNMFGVRITCLLGPVFFFTTNPEGKKNPLKFLLSFVYERQFCMWYQQKKNHPPLVTVLLLSLSLSLSKVKLFSSLSLSSGSNLNLTYIALF